MIGDQKSRIVLCGPDTGAIDALLGAAINAQTIASEADWGLNDPTLATLSREDGSYTLTALVPHPLWGPIFNRRHRREYAVEVRERLPADGGLPCVCVAFVHACAEPDEEALASLQNVAVDLVNGRARSVRRVVFVLTNALAELDIPIPYIDRLDAWERVRAGELPGKPPMAVARDVHAWHDAVERMDRAWGRRLRGLARDAKRRGIEIVTLPVSLSGFGSSTGMIVPPDSAQAGSIPFNLRPLVHVLCPEAPLGLPSLLDAVPQ